MDDNENGQIPEHRVKVYGQAFYFADDRRRIGNNDRRDEPLILNPARVLPPVVAQNEIARQADTPRKIVDQTSVGMAILENRLFKKVRVLVLIGRRSAPEIIKNRPIPGAVR